MIQKFVEAFEKNKAAIREHFEKETPQRYFDVVKNVIAHLNTGGYSDPDPERIEEIDHGDYQGTLLYVIGGRGYQPDNYWYVKVSYGSCSGCDTLQYILDYSENVVDELMTLALHIVQELKEME